MPCRLCRLTGGLHRTHFLNLILVPNNKSAPVWINLVFWKEMIFAKVIRRQWQTTDAKWLMRKADTSPFDQMNYYKKGKVKKVLINIEDNRYPSLVWCKLNSISLYWFSLNNFECYTNLKPNRACIILKFQN